MIGSVATPRDSLPSRIASGLVGAAVGCLLVVTGGWFALCGLSLYNRRIKTARIGAFCGLLGGLLFGAFIMYVGVIGFLMSLQ